MKTRFLAPAGFALLALLACKTDKAPSLSTLTSGTLAPGRDPASHAPIPDAKLVSAIEHALGRDPLLRSQPIRVSAANGAVTMSGAAPTLAAARRAARLAAIFKGAVSVTDTIVVNAPARPDADIAKDVNDAFRSDPATRSAKVQATVNAATVTLSGVADSHIQRELLIDAASRVRGVKQVTSAVALSAVGSRGDAELAADVTDRFAEDARLAGSPIAVAVHGRHATVSGVVGSAAQRDAAVEDALVVGVIDADASALRVDWFDNARGRAAARFPLPSDGQIGDAVGRWLSSDPRVGMELPSIHVDKGVITLAGNVEDFRAKSAAADDAARVSGGRKVEDRMTVLPAKPESDATIQKQAVQGILEDVSAPDSSHVQVATRNAKVTLRGPVASLEEKKNLESDAEEVPGVVDVENDLTVQGYGPHTVALAPESLRHEIIEGVFWDPRIDDDRITVDIAPNGDVTLNGVVDSWAQARAANDDAVRAGAAQVTNGIRIADATTSNH